jgi:hypothetical protein
MKTDGAGKRVTRVSAAPSLADNVIYADGVQALAVKGGVVQLDLFQTLTVTQSHENRVVSHRLVLPVAAVNDLLRMLQTMSKSGGSKS